jgi:hypothetical protein
MKEIIPFKKQTLSLGDIDYKYIIAATAYNKKYVFSIHSHNEVALVSGNSRWNTWDNIGEAIKELLEDTRVQLYYFESIADLAEWLKS